MHKIIWPIAAVLLIISAGAFAALQNSVRFKPMLPGGVPRDISEKDMAALEDQWREEIRPTLRPASQAAVVETEYDFGQLDPGYPGSHTFTIRNEGTETLHLGDPKADSDYIEGEFKQRTIAPGASGKFTVRWQPVHITSGHYRGVVTLPTSDPDHEMISFRIHGEIVRRLTAIPGSLNFGDIDPLQQSTPKQTIIGSEIWNSFEIVEVKCEMDGVTWEFEPATADELADHKFAGGYRLCVSLPENLQQGRNVTYLKLKIQPPEKDAEPLDCQLRLAARSLRRLCIYGDEIDKNAVVDFGQIRFGTAKSASLRVKIRDPETDVRMLRFEVNPSFVQVQWIEQEIEESSGGNYVLRITVPNDAPQCTYLMPQEFGTLKIITDHPRIPEETLRLRLAVTPPRR